MSENYAQRRRKFRDFFRHVKHVPVDPQPHPDLALGPPQPGVQYPCPCCGYPTLHELGGYDVCWVCDWEDDGQDDPHADEVWGGPNGYLSLTDCRRAYEQNVEKGKYFKPWGWDNPVAQRALHGRFEALSAMLRTDDAEELNRLWQTALDIETILFREGRKDVKKPIRRPVGE